MRKKVCNSCNYIAKDTNDILQHHRKTGHKSFSAKWVTIDGNITELKKR